MGIEQKVEANGILSGQQLLDPRPSTNIDVNEVSVSDDKSPELSVSPSSNNVEVMSNQREHHHQLTKLLGKQAAYPEDSSQSWGSSKTPKLHDSKNEEQNADIPFRKARVSVRARSEAPTVLIIIFRIYQFKFP